MASSGRSSRPSSQHCIGHALCTRCSQLAAEDAEPTLAGEGPQVLGVPSREMGKVDALTEDLVMASLPFCCCSLSYQIESLPQGEEKKTGSTDKAGRMGGGGGDSWLCKVRPHSPPSPGH